ncbi:MAG: hypothetical protein QXI16_03235 [Sulfolobaceae archaeon]
MRSKNYKDKLLELQEEVFPESGGQSQDLNTKPKSDYTKDTKHSNNTSLKQQKLSKMSFLDKLARLWRQYDYHINASYNLCLYYTYYFDEWWDPEKFNWTWYTRDALYKYLSDKRDVWGPYERLYHKY